METVLPEVIEDCRENQNIVENVIESEDINNSISVDEDVEKLIKSETYDDNVIEIKAADNLSTTSTYVIPEKPKVNNKNLKSVKNRQIAAVKSVVDRPKTAREKSKIISKNVLKPHSPGEIPSYLLKRKANLSKSASKLKVEVSKSKESTANEGEAKIQSVRQEQGDIKKSLTSIAADDHNNDSVKIKNRATTPNSMVNLRSQIMDLEMKNKSLEKQLEEAKSTRDKSSNELKISQDKIKSLETRTARNIIDQKKNEEKMARLEVDIANLIKEKQDMSAQIKFRIEENQKMEKRIENLKNELIGKSNSVETLIVEKNHLQALLDHKEMCGNEESKTQSSEKIETLLHEIKTLKNELNGKINEVESLNHDKINLIGEIDHLKTQIGKLPADSTNEALINEIKSLQHQVLEMSKNEKELNQKILTLSSKLDDEKNANIRINTLLEFRAEYIKTLQDVDNVNKARLILHAKELEDARKQLKSFEKFKASHAEEKDNFKKLLKNLETENTRLKTKVEMYKEMGLKLNQK